MSRRLLPNRSPGMLLRGALSPWFLLPCYAPSSTGARHYLSDDPIDDLVLEEILGSMRPQFFPQLPESVLRELHAGGCVMDLGAFNGYWGTEMLRRHPSSRAILLEPNPVKQPRIHKTLVASRVADRARVIPAGLGASHGKAWLVSSEEGSWGNWTQSEDLSLGSLAQPVELVTLVEALHGVRPLVIKCNAEGAEYEFVRQAIAAEIKPALMILMVHPEHGDPGALRDTLTGAGYEVRVSLDHPTRPCWHACRIEKWTSP